MLTSTEGLEKTLENQETLAAEEVVEEEVVEGLAMQVGEVEHHYPQEEPLEGMVGTNSSDSPPTYSQEIKLR